MFNDSLIARGLTGCFSSAGLAEGTNANTFKINATDPAGVHFAIDGVMYYKANTDNLAMTAAAAQADLTTCLYLVELNSSGTASTVKGDEVLTADLTAGTKVLHWPKPSDPKTKCPIGAIKVVNSGGTFTAGSTDLGAGTVTDSYYNFAGGMPVYPLTS